MALFLVVALQSSAPLVDHALRVKIQPADFYQVEPGKALVDIGGISTSKEAADFLGLSMDAVASYLVVPVRGYYGRAQPDLWEWLAAKVARVNA